MASICFISSSHYSFPLASLFLMFAHLERSKVLISSSQKESPLTFVGHEFSSSKVQTALCEEIHWNNSYSGIAVTVKSPKLKIPNFNLQIPRIMAMLIYANRGIFLMIIETSFITLCQICLRSVYVTVITVCVVGRGTKKGD